MAPSKLLLSFEVIRAAYEHGLAILFGPTLKYMLPKGDGHPVIVIPGLGAADGSTKYIRTLLIDLGYDARPWGLGRNLGPRKGMDAMLKDLSSLLNEVSSSANGKQVSLIGWSLGGIYARELAKIDPDNVRQVITLGTPFKGGSKTNAEFLYELLSKDTSHKESTVLERISTPPPVPFTSLYSKTDGVVHWKSSIEDYSDISENIEVLGGSHLGLGYNPIVMYLIADRLKQTKELWSPY